MKKIVWVTKVISANFLRDFGQHLKNILGGRLKSYENLINETMELTTKDFMAKYPNATNIKIDLHEFSQQAISVTVYGVIEDGLN